MRCVGILGYGEIGVSTEKLYCGKDYVVRVLDPEKKRHDSLKGATIVNVCIPYSDQFIDTVCDMIESAAPLLTILHSSVPVGTTEAIQNRFPRTDSHFTYVVHSPVRGNHPCLYYSLKTFIKYIGSDTEIGRDVTIDHFNELGIQSKFIGPSKTTELAKLLCTSYYGLCIAWHHEMERLCEENNVNFELAVEHWNSTYNDGYRALGMDNVVRPILYPPKGKIGGHCVVPNAELLQKHADSAFLDLILQLK